MARSEITGKRRLAAQNVSHSNIKTKRWQNVNVQRRRLWVPELGRHVTLKLTTGDLRSIDKVGLLAYAKKHGVTLKDSTIRALVSLMEDDKGGYHLGVELRGKYTIPTEWGAVAPRFRVEYHHDFAGTSTIFLQYADLFGCDIP